MSLIVRPSKSRSAWQWRLSTKTMRITRCRSFVRYSKRLIASHVSGRLHAYGHRVCETKINPAPKSKKIKLVTKFSPLAAKDTIIAPRVSTPAFMCFGSIIDVTSRINRRRQDTCHEKTRSLFHDLLEFV